MPNHIRNLLTIYGSEEAVAEFAENAKTLDRGQPGTRHGYGFHLDFNRILPLPQHYYRKDVTGEEAVKIQKQTWGVKWGPYNEGVPVADPCQVTYIFDTAWMPCIEFIHKIRGHYTKLLFIHSYGGEGPTRGYGLYHPNLSFPNSSEETFQSFGDQDNPWRQVTPYEEDEESHLKEYDAVTYLHTREHFSWAGSRIAIELGMRFSYDDACVKLIMSDWLDDNGSPNFAEQLRSEPNETISK